MKKEKKKESGFTTKQKERNKKILLGIVGGAILYGILKTYVHPYIAVGLMIVLGLGAFKFYLPKKYFEVKEKLLAKDAKEVKKK